MRQRTIPAPESAAAADFSQPDTREGGRDAVARFGNQVRAVYEALSYRKTAHYRAARQGRLVTADNLIDQGRYLLRSEPGRPAGSLRADLTRRGHRIRRVGAAPCPTGDLRSDPNQAVAPTAVGERSVSRGRRSHAYRPPS